MYVCKIGCLLVCGIFLPAAQLFVIVIGNILRGYVGNLTIMTGRNRTRPAAAGGSYAAGYKGRRYAAALDGTRMAGCGGEPHKADRNEMRAAGRGGNLQAAAE